LSKNLNFKNNNQSFNSKQNKKQEDSMRTPLKPSVNIWQPQNSQTKSKRKALLQNVLSTLSSKPISLATQENY